jgi:hypothetical protein
MRSGKTIFVLSLTLIACLALIIAGCSDDAKPTISAPTEQDLNYTAVSDETNEVLDSAISSFATSLEVFTMQTPSDTSISVVYSPINPDSIAAENNWHIVYASELATGYSWNLIDSIQFRKNGIAQESALNADQMTLHHNFSLEYGDTTSFFRNREGYANLEFTNLDTDVATVNGTREVSIQTRAEVNGETWRRDFNIELSFANVTVPRADDNWLRGCPNSGTVTGTVTLVSSRGANDPTESKWDFEVTFDNGIIDATVTSGTYTKSYTTTLCDM